MPNGNNPESSSEVASRRMKAVGQRDTAAEMEIRRRVHAKGLRYRVNHPILQKPRRTADMAFTKAHVAVLVDGCFWHGCPAHGTASKSNAKFWREKIQSNRKRDLDTNARLNAAGWEVLRFWEHEDPELAAEKIVQAVRERSAHYSAQY